MSIHQSKRRTSLSTLALSRALPCAGPALAQDRFIVMASPTSTEQSGLFAHLLPAFQRATGIRVRVVALGTGRALDSARRGDADVVFVHDQAAEEKFVAVGFGLKRLPVMYNDLILIGPRSDPAGVRGKDIHAALKKLAGSTASFISRGDKSGTYAAELRYWKAADVNLAAARPRSPVTGSAASRCSFPTRAEPGSSQVLGQPGPHHGLVGGQDGGCTGEFAPGLQMPAGHHGQHR